MTTVNYYLFQVEKKKITMNMESGKFSIKLLCHHIEFN